MLKLQQIHDEKPNLTIKQKQKVRLKIKTRLFPLHNNKYNNNYYKNHKNHNNLRQMLQNILYIQAKALDSILCLV